MVIPSLRQLRRLAATATFRFEPVRHLDDGAVRFWEARANLADTEFSWERFLRLGERAGALDELHCLLLDAAIQAADAGFRPLSFDVSALGCSPRFAAHAASLNHGGNELLVEIGDQDAHEELLDSVRVLHDAGVPVVSDHLGCGASDVFRLRRLRAAYAKLAPSMLAPDQSEQLETLLRAVPKAVPLIATGLDDLELLLFVVRRGVRFGQGEVLSAPLEATG